MNMRETIYYGNSLRILFLIDSLTLGGAQRAVVNFANELSNIGCQIGVMAYEKSEKDYYVDDKINIYIKGQDWSLIRNRVRRIHERIRCISHTIQEFRPDVVIPFSVPMVTEAAPI